jgi:hypothetical protein
VIDEAQNAPQLFSEMQSVVELLPLSIVELRDAHLLEKNYSAF